MRAFRRSALIVLICVIVGLALGLVVSAASSPQYTASASVLLTDINASAVVSGASSQSNPTLAASDAVSLGASNEFYNAVARAYSPRPNATLPGTYDISPQSGSDVLSVSAKAGSPAKAIDLANLVAREFSVFRGQKLSQPLETSRAELAQQLKGKPTDTEAKDSLARIQILRDLNAGNSVVVNVATTANKLRPAPVKYGLIGALAGLVIGLLIMAIREGLARRPRGPEEVESLLGLHVVARVPDAGARVRRGSGGLGPAYDRLAIQLHHRRQSDDDAVDGTVLGIISSAPGEGRTTVAAALVAAFEHHALSAVAVQLTEGDEPADLGRRLSTVLGREPEAHEQRLRGDDGAMLTMFSSVPVAVQVVGSAAGRRAAPIGSANGDEGPTLSGALRAIAAQYDWVIVDAPSMKRSALADELALVADMTLVVVNPSAVSREDLVRYAGQWISWPWQPFGAVITDG